MKLTAEQITFIDTYLKNSGVEYADIRYEMTDHVAAALEEQEGDFYENFKHYMLLHKKGLLLSNKHFAKTAQRKALRLLLFNMVKPLGLVLFIMFLGTLFILAEYVGKEDLLGVLNLLYVASGACFVLFCKLTNRIPGDKYSVSDKYLGALIFIIYIIFIGMRPDRLIPNTNTSFVLYALFGAFIVANILTFNSIYSKYKLRYNG